MSVELRAYRVHLEGQLLVVKGKGPWGETAVAHYQEQVVEAIRHLAGKEWAILGFLSGTALLTPQAEDTLCCAVEWRVKHGMKACSLVLNKTDYPAIIRSQTERMYRKAGATFAIFHTEIDARAWLQKLGFANNNL